MAVSQPLPRRPLRRGIFASGAPLAGLRRWLRSPPLQTMGKISARLGNTILVKREDRQPVHSFKLRGAYAMIASLDEEQRVRGVVTASAGQPCTGRRLFRQPFGDQNPDRDAGVDGGYQG
ncbi:L-threonine dehydratase biosynthetic IlvA [Serratia fonticola]|uniref:L-threonine dehydratase biosynthetic IlvA n=1 Tax=Serratia fonticola TaxID=47917 RepID=A0A4U9U346_SERFO|nr:L-threonine dehydratase biosynthetic IlvA [Serratia fonticola]